MFFLHILLLYSKAWFRQTKDIVMMTKEGSTKIVNFMAPGAGILLKGMDIYRNLRVIGLYSL